MIRKWFTPLVTVVGLVVVCVYALRLGREGIPTSLIQIPPSKTTEYPHRALFNAIAWVEGSVLNPYQISRAYWKDGCKAGGVDWD